MGRNRPWSELSLAVAIPLIAVLLIAVPAFLVSHYVSGSAVDLLAAVETAGDEALFETVSQEIENLRSRTSSTFFVLSVVAVLGAALAGGYIARTLHQLTEWASGLRRGRHAGPLTVEGPTELALLCRTLNRLGTDVRDELGRLGASEDRFRGFIESMSEGMVVVDCNERITFVNQRFAKMLGIPLESVQGLEITCLLDAENKEKLLRESRKRRAGKPGRYELVWHRSDGERVFTLVSAVSLMSPGGRFEGSFAVLTDVTERRRLEEQMSRAEKLRALGEMAGGIAHDFNNRLTAILGNAQLLLMDSNDPRVLPGLRVIEQAAMEGAETVRRILEFTRQTPEVDREDIDLAPLIDEVLELLRFRRKDDQSAAPHYRIRRDLRATRAAHGYPSELREALLNVLTNALDAMAEGGELRVTTYDHEEGVGIRIADTGHGMSKATAKRVFDPFFTTRGVDRTGLGLSIVYGIIRRQEGKVSIRSSMGQGTTVTILLPASNALPLQDPAPAPTSESPGEEARRILVVDDEKEVAGMLEAALTRRGYLADTAGSGAEALDLIAAGRDYDLLLTDLAMPGMRGTELAEEARRLVPGIRTILFTGWGPEAEDEIARSSAVDLLVKKPFSLPELFDQIDEIVDARAGNRKTSRK